MNTPKGRLLMTIRSADGELVGERRATNRVLRKGAEVMAGLFAGTRTSGIDRIRVGFGTQPLPDEATGLTPEPLVFSFSFLNLGPDPGVEAKLDREKAFTASTGETAVTINVTASFTPIRDLKDVSEAGLFAGDDIYNQVLFEPINMTTGQVVTFFWQIDFPFGR